MNLNCNQFQNEASNVGICTVLVLVSQATPFAQKKKAEGSGDCAYNDSFHSPAIDGEAYFVCTAYEALIVNTQILRYNYK